MFGKYLSLISAIAMCLVSAAAFAAKAPQSVTVWGIFFNEPENCTDGDCSEDDVFDVPHLANVSVVYLAGQRLRKGSLRAFAAAYGTGTDVGAIFGPGLVDAHRAEIHLLVRNHGDWIRSIADEQLSTLVGGCSVATCENLQFAVFKPRKANAEGHSKARLVRFEDGKAVRGGTGTIWRMDNGFSFVLHTRLR